MRQQSARGRRGFTLVEILIAILIIGILLAVAVPQFISAREQSQARACQHNLKAILGAKERWAMQEQRGATDSPTWSDLTSAGGYLKFIPECPGGGTYSIGALDKFPTCSIGGPAGNSRSHAIE